MKLFVVAFCVIAIVGITSATFDDPEQQGPGDESAVPDGGESDLDTAATFGIFRKKFFFYPRKIYWGGYRNYYNYPRTYYGGFGRSFGYNGGYSNYGGYRNIGGYGGYRPYGGYSQYSPYVSYSSSSSLDDDDTYTSSISEVEPLTPIEIAPVEPVKPITPLDLNPL